MARSDDNHDHRQQAAGRMPWYSDLLPDAACFRRGHSLGELRQFAVKRILGGQKQIM